MEQTYCYTYEKDSKYNFISFLDGNDDDVEMN